MTFFAIWYRMVSWETPQARAKECYFKYKIWIKLPLSLSTFMCTFCVCLSIFLIRTLTAILNSRLKTPFWLLHRCWSPLTENYFVISHGGLRVNAEKSFPRSICLNWLADKPIIHNMYNSKLIIMRLLNK